MYPFSSRLAPQPSYDFTGLLAPRPAPVPRDPMIPLSQMNIPSGYATRAFAPVISAGMPDMSPAATSAPTPQPRGLFTGTGSSARLLSLGQSLLAPSRIPTTLGGRIASGLAAGQQAAQQEQERVFKRGLLEQEADLAKSRLALEREKLDIEKEKLKPATAVRTGFAVVYDNKSGRPKTVETYKDALGNVSYKDASSKDDIDFTEYSLNKPEAVSEDLGTPRVYINKKTGESEYIVEVKRNGKSSFEKQNLDGSFTPISLADYKEPISKEEKAATLPTADKIYDYANDAMTTENSIGTSLVFLSGLDRAIETGNFGLSGLVNNFIGKIKTATGGDLTKEQALRQLLSSYQAGIVGQSRVEILGPGVLSNQDIDFLFNAVGGRVDSLIANPHLMRELLLKNYSSKIKSYKFQSTKYNANKKYLGGDNQPVLSPSFTLNDESFDGFIDPDFFMQGGNTIMFMKMSPTQKREVLMGFDNG
jgi:hypothetical protein